MISKSHKLFIPGFFLLIVIFPEVVFAFEGEDVRDLSFLREGEHFAGGVIRDFYCDAVGLMEGTLGALLLAVAGTVAVGQAVFGDFSGAKSALITGVGAVSLAVATSLAFGAFDCGGDDFGDEAGIEENGGDFGGGAGDLDATGGPLAPGPFGNPGFGPNDV